jgi:hypothetical protein
MNEEWRNDSTGIAYAFETPPAPEVASSETTATTPTPAPAEEPLLNAQKIADVLDVSYGQVFWYLKKKYIKSRHVPSGGRKTYVVTKSDLEAWLSKPAQRARFTQLYWDRLK